MLGESGTGAARNSAGNSSERGATPRRHGSRIVRGIPAGSLAVARGVLDAVGGFVDGGLLDDPQVLRTALKALPARAESVEGGYVDGAHTAASVAAFAKSVKRKGRGVVLIIALRADKDVESVARAVREHLDPNPRRLLCVREGLWPRTRSPPRLMVRSRRVPRPRSTPRPCDEKYVRVALGSFELAAAARAAAWCV